MSIAQYVIKTSKLIGRRDSNSGGEKFKVSGNTTLHKIKLK